MAFVIPPPGPTSQNYRGCRALVVDPSTGTRRMVGQTLARLGMGRIEPCAASEDAWGLLDEGTFNLMFLDWSKELDAIAFLEELRSLSNPHRMLPVVVTTGFAQRDHMIRAVNAGVNEVALKPLSSGIIASRIRAIVHEPRIFIRTDDYFGPDRRRWRELRDGADERRTHQNWRAPDRRQEELGPPGIERRQGQPGYVPQDRRAGPRA